MYKKIVMIIAVMILGTTIMAKERYESAASIDLARNFMDTVDISSMVSEKMLVWQGHW